MAARWRVAAPFSSGNASSFAATTVTSCPCARAAASTRNGNVPLPAMSPNRMRPLLLRHELLGAPRGAPQDDTALGGADEVDERLHFARGQAGVALDRRERPAGVQLRLQQVAVGAFELAD